MSDLSAAAKTVATLAGLYAKHEAPDAAQRAAAYWWGSQDEYAGWWLALCRKYEGMSISAFLRKNVKDAEHKFWLAREAA